MNKFIDFKKIKKGIFFLSDLLMDKSINFRLPYFYSMNKNKVV